MKRFTLLFICLMSTLCSENVAFHEKYGPIYQDVLIGDQIVVKGLNLCDVRYELIKSVFDLYKSPFSVLEIGAAQGYFSFRIAHDYPHAHCTMIEENSSDYLYHGDLLYDLCLLNQMKNVTYLRKRMSYQDLSLLNSREHFDVLLIFLVLHQMAEHLSDQLLFLEKSLSLADNVIIEVADDVATPLTQFIEAFGQHVECEFLGEVKRFQNPYTPGKGRVYWFKGAKTKNRQKVSKETFQILNGVYPIEFLD